MKNPVPWTPPSPTSGRRPSLTANVNGFGTKFYGECDYREEGSYVTTEWWILLFFPVFPIRSHRVRYTGAGSPSVPLFYRSDSYIHYQTMPVRKWQVARTYLAAFLLAFVWTPLLIATVVQMPAGPYGIYVALVIAAGFVAPMLGSACFRRWAKRRGRKRPEAVTPGD